jgi:hypothetical protein
MLNIDEVAAAIRSVSPEEPAQHLGELFIEWKHTDTTAEGLKSRIERAIGYIWFSTDAVPSEVYRLWSEFRSGAIDGIGGMTMNERLYWFGVFERYDEAKTEEARKKIYAKPACTPLNVRRRGSRTHGTSSVWNVGGGRRGHRPGNLCRCRRRRHDCEIQS